MADAKKLKVGSLVRNMQLHEFEVRKAEDGKTRFAFTLSSEYAVDRGWGSSEILSHAPDAVRLTRATSGAMPLLFNHNPDDPVGMVDAASIKSGKMRVEGSFFNTARAQDVAAMVDGGLRNVSVGYRIHAVEENLDDDTYTVTDWEPYEASIAPVPADPTVGVGRSLGSDVELEVRKREPHKPPEVPAHIESIEPRSERGSSFSAAAAVIPTLNKEQSMSEVTPAAEPTGTRAAPSIQVTGTPGDDAVAMEQARVRAIENLCRGCSMDDDLKNRWISSGASIEKVTEQVMNIQLQRGKQNETKNVSSLGLSESDRNRFSIVRAINACATGDWRKAGFEAECSMEIGNRMQKLPDPKKFYVPYDVQQRGISERALRAQQRALSNLGPYGTRADTVGTSSQGGYLVETVNLGFIELLRNRSVAYRLGAKQLSGLTGNVNIPKQTGASTAYWLASETSTATEVEQAFGQLSLTPHTVAGYTEISRLLLLQSSPDVEGIVNADLAAIVALAVDKGALSGSGTAGQPTGITVNANVGAIGAVGASSYANQLAAQALVAAANVMPVSGGTATNPTVASYLMSKTRFANTNTPLWDGNLWDANGALQCAGFPGMSSNQIAAGSYIFGDWDTLVIAEWGVLEIEVNPYAGFQAGIIGIRAMTTIDVGIRYPGAFVSVTGITS